MRYALLRHDGAVLNFIEAAAEDEAPQSPEDGRWLPAVVILPEHDPRTHTLIGPEEGVVDQPDGSAVFEQRFTVHARPLEDVQAEVIAAIKAEAGARILAIAPEWKQRNVTARAAELALLHPGTRGDDLPEPERTEWQEGQALWGRIKAVRVASDAAEVSARSAGDPAGVWAALDAFCAT